MRFRHSFMLGAATCAVLIAGCGGGGSTSPGGRGVVQISGYIVNPQAVECGFTLSSPPMNIGEPDSVTMQVTLVNTTRNDVTLISGGSQGTVIRSSNASDVGASALAYATLPFTPQGATVGALRGEVAFRLMLPTYPFCQSKPLHYVGWQDVDMTARLIASTGSYVTVPKVIRVNWH